MDLRNLHYVASERNAAWTEAQIGWTVVDGPLTDKPAAWLILDSGANLGQLTVWVSGEAEMDWGTREIGGERHYELASIEELRAAIYDLEQAVTQH